MGGNNEDDAIVISDNDDDEPVAPIMSISAPLPRRSVNTSLTAGPATSASASHLPLLRATARSNMMRDAASTPDFSDAGSPPKSDNVEAPNVPTPNFTDADPVERADSLVARPQDNHSSPAPISRAASVDGTDGDSPMHFEVATDFPDFSPEPEERSTSDPAIPASQRVPALSPRPDPPAPNMSPPPLVLSSTAQAVLPRSPLITDPATTLGESPDNPSSNPQSEISSPGKSSVASSPASPPVSSSSPEAHDVVNDTTNVHASHLVSEISNSIGQSQDLDSAPIEMLVDVPRPTSQQPLESPSVSPIPSTSQLPALRSYPAIDRTVSRPPASRVTQLASSPSRPPLSATLYGGASGFFKHVYNARRHPRDTTAHDTPISQPVPLTSLAPYIYKQSPAPQSPQGSEPLSQDDRDQSSPSTTGTSQDILRAIVSALGKVDLTKLVPGTSKPITQFLF